MTYLVSVPMPTPFDQALVSSVLELYYDCDQPPVSCVSRKTLDQVVNALGFALDYLLYQVDGDIRHAVSKVAHSASGISALLDGVFPSIARHTSAKEAAIYHWSGQEANLKLERSAGFGTPPETILQRNVASGQQHTNLRMELVRCCVEKRRPLVLGGGVASSSDPVQRALEPGPSARGHLLVGEPPSTTERLSFCPSRYLAVPVLSTSGAVLGVLTCGNPLEQETAPVSFSSLDVHTLSIFADCIAPYMERFLRLREGSILMKVVNEVASAVAGEYLLDDLLQKTIETVVNSLQAEVGSIFLFDEHTNKLIMRAGTGPAKGLVKKAQYEVGEGLTGEIAKGKILNFKTWEELAAHPARKGKYDKQMWPSPAGARCTTFLGLPITDDGRKLGVWKVANLSPSPEHPDGYFTDEDVEAGKVLSSFLAYVIRDSRQREQTSRQFSLLAQNSIDIARAKDEEDAICTVIQALAEIGFKEGLLSLYDQRTGHIKGFTSFAEKWSAAVAMTRVGINDADLLAEVLRTNKPVFVPDSREDPRCNQEIVRGVDIAAQFVMPLRLEEELIGVLQIDMADRRSLRHEEDLVLRAFGDHLTVALSRVRSAHRSLELADHVMSGSRFIVAETLSSMAVHSTGHKIDELLARLRNDLKKPTIRQNRFLLETLQEWYETLGTVEVDLRKALQIVKSGPSEVAQTLTDVHVEIQNAIDQWISFIKTGRTRLQLNLEAPNRLCQISANSLREILSVLIVNSVQAHAKQILVRTYNGHNVSTPPENLMQDVIRVEFSDDGDGLVTSDPEEIFKATYTTKPEKFGTGLGLFIARRLARRGGGNLEVADEPSRRKGVTFLLTLPYREQE
ncbi:MAG: GAF domain-containing protein [Deltaproteobacteria bacterium]|nr:GAF domain-containing protein [Deltaproteobacteria bacterium]